MRSAVCDSIARVCWLFCVHGPFHVPAMASKFLIGLAGGSAAQQEFSPLHSAILLFWKTIHHVSPFEERTRPSLWPHISLEGLSMMGEAIAYWLVMKAPISQV